MTRDECFVQSITEHGEAASPPHCASVGLAPRFVLSKSQLGHVCIQLRMCTARELLCGPTVGSKFATEFPGQGNANALEAKAADLL